MDPAIGDRERCLDRLVRWIDRSQGDRRSRLIHGDGDISVSPPCPLRFEPASRLVGDDRCGHATSQVLAHEVPNVNESSIAGTDVDRRGEGISIVECGLHANRLCLPGKERQFWNDELDFPRSHIGDLNAIRIANNGLGNWRGRRAYRRSVEGGDRQALQVAIENNAHIARHEVQHSQRDIGRIGQGASVADRVGERDGTGVSGARRGVNQCPSVGANLHGPLSGGGLGHRSDGVGLTCVDVRIVGENIHGLIGLGQDIQAIVDRVGRIVHRGDGEGDRAGCDTTIRAASRIDYQFGPGRIRFGCIGNTRAVAGDRCGTVGCGHIDDGQRIAGGGRRVIGQNIELCGSSVFGYGEGVSNDRRRWNRRPDNNGDGCRRGAAASIADGIAQRLGTGESGSRRIDDSSPRRRHGGRTALRNIRDTRDR